MESNVFEIFANETYRNSLLNEVCNSVDSEKRDEFRNILNYFIDNKLHLFDSEVFKLDTYGDGTIYADLLIPSIRRIWCFLYVKPPSLINGKKLELLQLIFDIDDFSDYLLTMIPKTVNLLKDFDKLDRTVETLELIIDQYLAGLIDDIKNTSNIGEEIRELKIKKILK
jgi:hypothetical protein